MLVHTVEVNNPANDHVSLKQWLLLCIACQNVYSCAECMWHTPGHAPDKFCYTSPEKQQLWCWPTKPPGVGQQGV